MRWVLLLLALAGVAHAADELDLPPVTRVTLENGMRVLVAESRELPLVEMYVMVGAGAAQDPSGKEGVASLTAGLLRRGAGELSAEALARAIESLGGHLEAAAGTDATIVNGEFLSEDFPRGLDLLRMVLREPRFEKDEVRRQRDEQLAQLVAELEDPSAVAEKCFASFLYGSYSYGRPQDGLPKTVADLGRSDVRDFYGKWYAPNNTILVLVGDVAAADAVARVREAFGSWPARADAVPERAGPPPPTIRWPLAGSGAGS